MFYKYGELWIVGGDVVDIGLGFYFYSDNFR